MKNIFSMLMLMGLLVAFTSCEKEEIGNTALVDMAGEWYVTMAAVNDAGDVLDEDFFGYGPFIIVTANTAKNNTEEMLLTDNNPYSYTPANDEGFYFPYHVIIPVDFGQKAFHADAVENTYYKDEDQDGSYLNEDGDLEMVVQNHVTITGGRILKDGTMTPSGQKADYIEFYIEFDDDPYPAYYSAKYASYEGFTRYKVSGYRYTGFVEDD